MLQIFYSHEHEKDLHDLPDKVLHVKPNKKIKKGRYRKNDKQPSGNGDLPEIKIHGQRHRGEKEQRIHERDVRRQCSNAQDAGKIGENIYDSADFQLGKIR